MKSNVCKIERGAKVLEEILKESERVAQYNGFTHKQGLHLRLLCEEIDGMLPNIIGDFEGKLWIEYNDGVCKVNVSIQIPEFNLDKKEELIAIAKNKKNAAAVGIVGKIRSAIEDFFLNAEPVGCFDSSFGAFYETGYTGYTDCSYLWSLDNYRSSVEQAKQSDAWDELEKSVIASVADDVIVGVKGNQANITVIKKFA